MVAKRLRRGLRELRIMLAEQLLLAALYIMPKNHPSTMIWARHLGDGGREVQQTIAARVRRSTP